jgi:uncharacterized membrane protein
MMDIFQFAILFVAVCLLIVGWCQTARLTTIGTGEALGVAGMILLALDAFMLLARMA